MKALKTTLPKDVHALHQLTSPQPLPLRIRLLTDLLVLAGIGLVAWYYAGFLLRDDLYLYGDHPGQFYRMWQLITLSWSEEGRLISWAPYWHAGRAELQFYPPGSAFLGWLIWLSSFNQLSMIEVYQALIFITYLLPGVSFYLMMAWGLGDRLAGLIAAWLVLTFPFPLGGVQAVIIGILGYQLAYGLTPFLILAGEWGMRAGRQAVPLFIMGLLIAAIILLHPFQVIYPLGVLVLVALLNGQGRFRQLRWLALAVIVGLGLTAFWWLPLITQLQNFVPVVEGTLLDILNHLRNMWLAEVGWLLAIALLGSFFQPARRRSLALAMLGGGAVLLGFILLNSVVIVEWFNIFVLDSVRMLPGFTFAMLIGWAIGVSKLAWLAPRLLHRWGWSIAGLPVLVVVPWLFYNQVSEAHNFDKWITKYQPAPDKTPFFLREAEAKYNLPAIWKVMAATPGRVLFTSAYALLYDVPTSLKAMTPVLTDREVVGGVFTLRSPVASYLWTGERKPPVLRGKVEQTDNLSFAGVAWEAMTDEVLLNIVRHFNITLIATIATDVKAQAFLDASSRFKPVWSNELFTFYTIVGYKPAWVEIEGATGTVSRYERLAIDVKVANARPGATMLVKVAHFPRWQADINGQPVPLSMDPHGLMELTLPPGSYTVRLRYGPAWPEKVGGMVSLLTLLATSGAVLQRGLSRRQVRPKLLAT
jgi:hypothetical protein